MVVRCSVSLGLSEAQDRSKKMKKKSCMACRGDGEKVSESTGGKFVEGGKQTDRAQDGHPFEGSLQDDHNRAM